MGVMAFLFAPSKALSPKSDSAHTISDGFNQMVNGLSLVLQGTENKLNDMIDCIMETEQSMLSDSDIEAVKQLEELVSFLRPLLGSEDAMPDEIRRSVARVIERGELLISLEQQLRPNTGKVLHVNFDANTLSQETNENRDITASGWQEDE